MDYEEKLQVIQANCPKLRFSAQFTDRSSQWNYKRHAHPYLELLYFTEGGGEIDVSGQQLCAGDGCQLIGGGTDFADGGLCALRAGNAAGLFFHVAKQRRRAHKAIESDIDGLTAEIQQRISC